MIKQHYVSVQSICHNASYQHARKQHTAHPIIINIIIVIIVIIINIINIIILLLLLSYLLRDYYKLIAVTTNRIL